jgi:serine/threonine protein kinase
VRKLGQGAFGEVEERVWHDTPVAVKSNGMGAGDVAALAAEVRLYERLAGSPHPNVVPVMGICVDAPDGKLRLIMRLCPKGSLDDLLAAARVEVG